MGAGMPFGRRARTMPVCVPEIDDLSSDSEGDIEGETAPWTESGRRTGVAASGVTQQRGFGVQSGAARSLCVFPGGTLPATVARSGKRT